ncbi:MAG: YedE family putative selenium transporter [Desulfuromonadia bacterium]
MKSWKGAIILTALLMGGGGVLLSVLGNPANSGICISCFLETSTGALGLHPNDRMRYLRPELPGFVLGAWVSALMAGEFRSRGGSAPLWRFVGGFIMIVGCAVFIGCPIKLILRLAAGDLSAVAGVAGLVVGVRIGILSLVRGVEFPVPVEERTHSGFLLPIASLFLILLFILSPPLFRFSEQGGGADAAPWYYSLSLALGIGFLAQKSRFCITGSLRDLLLMGWRSPMTAGFLTFLGAALATSLLFGRFHLSLTGQPGAHTDFLWSFLGMMLVGWVAMLVGGCPFRQLVKGGEGDTDAVVVTMGMAVGAALVQSTGIAATAAGVSPVGKVAILASLVIVAGMVLFLRERR